MKEEFKSNGWKDFAQRYSDTYGWYETETKNRILVKLEVSNPELLTFYDEKGMTYYAKPDQGNVFEFIPVTRGVYQYNNSVIYVSRKPARQWKRGICSVNTTLFDLVNQNYVDVNFNNIACIFGNKDTHILNKFKKDMSPPYVCLNEMFSLVDSSLMVYNTLVGKFNRDKREIKMSVPIFKQEVQDLFRSLSMEVVVE